MVRMDPGLRKLTPWLIGVFIVLGLGMSAKLVGTLLAETQDASEGPDPSGAHAPSSDPSGRQGSGSGQPTTDADEPPTDSSRPPADSGNEPPGSDGQPPDATVQPPEDLDGRALTAHRFVPVGGSTSIDGLGKVLEVSSLEPGEGVLSHDEAGATVTCSRAGTGFVRAQYRQLDDLKNRIQTMMVVCIDEAGACEGFPPVSLDLERYLTEEPGGEANYLAQGRGDLYGVCLVDGAYRLQQAPSMPPLMLRIIDAFGDGPYSFSKRDYDLVRNSTLLTYSGERLTAPWVLQVGWEIEEVSLHADGTVTFTPNDCNTSPSCTYDSDLARPGDHVILGFGVPGNVGLQGVVDETGPETLRRFVERHVDVDWNATTGLPEEARRVIVYRLIALEVMDRSLSEFDGHYGLRNSGISVGYDPYWQTRYRVSDHCLPEERARCQAIEDALDAYERERIGEWRSEGYDLWHVSSLAYDPQGRYQPLTKVAPSRDAFAGATVMWRLGRAVEEGDKTTALANALQSLAEELEDAPVILIAHSGPMRFAIDGVFCEAEICESSFSEFYALQEDAILAMLEAFAPGQVRAFAAAMLDGGVHFDIREPYEYGDETRGGVTLNRVGETGFNNPLLNLYLTR